MKKYLLLMLSIIPLFLNLGIAQAELITPEQLTIYSDMKKKMWMTDQEQAERLKIVYFYHDFRYKNMYVLFNKYVLPEYDKNVAYEDLFYLSNKDTRFSNNWMSENILDEMTDTSHEKFTEAFNIMYWDNSLYWFKNVSKKFVSWELDYLNNSYKLYDIKTAEREYAKALYSEILFGFQAWFKNQLTWKYEWCNGAWLDIFVRWTNKDIVLPLDNATQTNTCIATYTNPDLDKFKASLKDFFIWKNTYYNPVSVEVDPDYGNYINLYKIKENLPALVDKTLTLPAWYEKNKKPVVKFATTWGIKVQEKYPSIYETNNVIFNPNTNELNDSIVWFWDYYGDLVYIKYSPAFSNLKDWRTSWLFSSRWSTTRLVTKELISKYLNPIYWKQNTLSSVPHYFSTYNWPKLSIGKILDIQENNISYTQSTNNNVDNTNNTGSSQDVWNIGTPYTNFNLTLDWKKYEVTKFNWIYFRTKDDLYYYFTNNLLKPFLTKSKISEADFFKDADYKEWLILNNFNKLGFSNSTRIKKINGLNDDLKLFRYIINNAKLKYESDSVRYENNYKTYLQVFYIINYKYWLLNWNESQQYINFAKFLK